MIKFDVVPVADAAEEWTLTAGGWLCGKQFVRPFVHPSLDSGLYVEAGRTTTVVRERLDGLSELPVACATRPAVEELVQRTRSWPGDYVVLHRSVGRVSVEAGAVGAAPVYLSAGPSLRGSWDLGDLLDSPVGAGDLLFGEVAALLAGQPRYSPRTLFRHITRLTERSTATWRRGHGLDVVLPSDAEHFLPRELRSGAAVLDAYTHLLRMAVTRRAPAASGVTVEVSGGTDSTTVALAAADVLPEGSLTTYGIEILGPALRQQRSRRASIVAAAGARDTTVNAAAHLPLGEAPGWAGSGAIEERYGAALHAAIISGAAPVVLTGVGGDELLALRPEEREAGHRSHLSRWALARDAVDALASTLAVQHPVTAVPETALLANSVRTPVFLRAGRWPVAPLCDPDLTRFGEWLPFDWRAGKRVARDWLVERGLPHEVAWPSLRENFAEVMQRGLKRHGLPELRRMLDKGSLLVDYGYLDADLLRGAVLAAESAVRTRDPVDTRLHDVVALERFLTALA